MRIRDPKTTALIFASGKMVVTGAKTENMARLAARKYARIVQKLGFEATFRARTLWSGVAGWSLQSGRSLDAGRASNLLLAHPRAPPPPPPQDFMVQNIVASCDVKFPIRLEGLAFAHATFANVRLARPCTPTLLTYPHLPAPPSLAPLVCACMRVCISTSRSCSRA